MREERIEVEKPCKSKSKIAEKFKAFDNFMHTLDEWFEEGKEARTKDEKRRGKESLWWMEKVTFED